MDQSRRNTLKAIGATTIAATIGTLTPLSVATAVENSPVASPLSVDQFSVFIEHTWGGQEATVVIKNTSDHSATITDIKPSFVSAEPGLFDFSVVTRNGSRTLERDEEVRIPFTRMGSPMTAIGHFDHSLQKHLRNTLTIRTDQWQVAKTTTSLSPKIV